MHPRSKNWHLIDYVLVRQRDIQDVCHTRLMPSAECYTDHRLVRRKLRLLFKPKPRKGGPPKKKFKVGSFQSAERTADFQAGLQLRLVDSSCQVDPPLETLWVHLKTAISQTAEEVLGYTTRKNKDWFDENNKEIQELLTQKRSAHRPTWHSRHVLRRKQPSALYAANSSASSGKFRTSGGLTSQRVLRCAPMLATIGGSTKP